MSKPNSNLERRVRIELLRTRAAVERQELCVLTRQISQSLQPEHIFDLFKGQVSKSISSSFGSHTKTGHWLDFLLSFGKRYPLLVSGASALAGSVVSKKKWRLGALALTSWRLYSAYQNIQKRKRDRYIQPMNPKSSRIIGPF